MSKDTHNTTIDGVDYWYKLKTEKGNSKESELRIINSWQYSRKEMRVFLEWLSTQYEGVNVNRMMNEWKWHNVAYTMGIAKSRTESVDMYFDAPDDNFRFIFDTFWFWW